jgi:cytochrome c biogenesis protein CcmG/thiol:disulfide interchange protein DsbE
MPRRFASRTLAALFALPLLGVVSLSGEATREAHAQTKPKSGGWLGIMMEASKGKPGVLVTHVIHNSPAEKGGFLAGDRIVKLDGAAVAAPGEVSAPVAAKGPGKTITLDIVRSGKPQTLSVVLGPKPKPEDIFRMEMLGRKISLAPLTLVSGAGPTAYPALDGHVVVIDLFATWCGPCAAATPHMQALHAKYSPQGVTVLAISDEDTGTLSTWSTKNGVGYTVASDPTDVAFTQWGAPALPSSLIVDKHGVVREVEVGFDLASVKRTELLVQALLKEP